MKLENPTLWAEQAGLGEWKQEFHWAVKEDCSGFLAVQDSSIGDLVTQWLSQWHFWFQCDYKDYNDYNDNNDCNDLNDYKDHNDYNDYNDCNDYNDYND